MDKQGGDSFFYFPNIYITEKTFHNHTCNANVLLAVMKSSIRRKCNNLYTSSLLKTNVFAAPVINR